MAGNLKNCVTHFGGGSRIQEEIKVERPDVLGQVRYKGEDRVRAGHPTGRKKGQHLRQKECKGVESSEISSAYGLSQHSKVWGRGCL